MSGFELDSSHFLLTLGSTDGWICLITGTSSTDNVGKSHAIRSIERMRRLIIMPPSVVGFSDVSLIQRRTNILVCL